MYYARQSLYPLLVHINLHFIATPTPSKHQRKNGSCGHNDFLLCNPHPIYFWMTIKNKKFFPVVSLIYFITEEVEVEYINIDTCMRKVTGWEVHSGW